MKIFLVSDNSNWSDFLLVLLIIALTGFQFCFNSASGIFFLVGPLAVVMFYLRHRKISYEQLLFLAVFLIWESCQILYERSSTSAMINFFIRFLVYIIAAIAVNDFEKIYIRIIYYIALISIPMWLISNYLPDGYGLLTSLPEIKINGMGIDETTTSNPGYSLGFYYVSKGTRNSGPFWEPGMFCVFLCLAYVLHLIRTRNPFDKIGVIFVIAIVTTFSTSGYITLFVIIAWYYSVINFKPRSIIVALILAIAVVLFLNSEFGISKIESDANNTDTYSRFGAITYHMSLLVKNMFIGRGFASFENNIVETSPNGITIILLFWGIPFAIYYYILLFKSSKKLAFEAEYNNRWGKSAIIIFITLITVAFSQDVTARHFYYFLLMYGITPVNNISIKRFQE